MSGTSQAATSTQTLRIQRMPKWATGRSELIVVAGVLVLAALLTIGTITMEVPPDTAPPGPKFFPIIVTVFLYLTALALAVDVIRSSRRTHVADDPTEINTDMLGDLGDVSTTDLRVVAPEDYANTDTASAHTSSAGLDWKTLGIVVAALAVFILILPFVGWLLSSAALFWVISWAFGSTRPLFDIAVSALFAAIIQLAFSAALGLSLPSGILEGALPWIS